MHYHRWLILLYSYSLLLALTSCWNRSLSSRLTSSIAGALFSTTDGESKISQAKMSCFFCKFSACLISCFPVSFSSCNDFQTDGLHHSRAWAWCSISILSLSHSTVSLDLQSSSDKKLTTTQDRQTQQNSDEKQHCHSLCCATNNTIALLLCW